MPPKAPEQPSWRSRMLDMEQLVADHDPNAPKPWIVEPLIIEGMLAIVAGKSGAGKTWIIHEAADAVVRGKTNAGMTGHGPLPVLIIDAEMGEWLTTNRFKEQGYSTDIHVFNAQGMDLKNDKDRQQIFDAAIAILKPRGGLLCIDSLRAIVPSAKENDSDDMAPIVTWIKNLCRTTNAAGILIHHAGWREDRTRGSSAIKDQADTIWYLGHNDDGTLRFTCQGADLKAPRWGPPPRDMYLKIREDGGLMLADTPEERGEQLREDVLRVVRDSTPPITKQDQVPRALGKLNPASISRVKAVFQQLTREGLIVKAGPIYQVIDQVGIQPEV